MTTPDDPRAQDDGTPSDSTPTAPAPAPRPPSPQFTALSGAYSWPPKPVAPPEPVAAEPVASEPAASEPTAASEESEPTAAPESEPTAAPEPAASEESAEPAAEPLLVPPVVAAGLPGVPAMAAAPLAAAALTESSPEPNPDPDADFTSGPDATSEDAAPGPRARLGLVVAAVLLLALASAVAFLGVSVLNAARTETARTEAVAASRDAARVLFSYNHETLEDDFARGLSVTTGEFREEYERTTSEVVADVAREFEAVVLADVVESAVVEASPSEVTTIVFLNQATTSTRVTGQQVDQSRVQMRLVEVDGRWLVAEVTAL